MGSEDKKPRHIAFIMDGNGRWAEARGLSRTEGHLKGAERVVSLMSDLKRLDIQYATLYAFSTENWKRPAEEVSFLMELLCRFLDENVRKMEKNQIRLRVTGRMDELPGSCVRKLREVMERTEKFSSRQLILALNYGGRAELADAVRRIAEDVKRGDLKPEDIREDTVSRNLYLPDVPDPDLMIRTSGELRLSNFLLWQLSYSELYFTDVYWPDFDGAELEKAIRCYQSRNRRFGGRP